MEEQVVRWLTETQAAQEEPRKHAEWQLQQQYANPEFPVALVSIGAHKDVPIDVRQAALLYLKTFVLACWSPQFSEHNGQLFNDATKKAQIRQALLDLTLSGHDQRKIKNAASLVVSKIASADFPDEWPDLLPAVLNVAGSGAESQLHGALKVLGELVDDCFVDEQFFQVARDLVKALHGIAVNENHQPMLRALAVSVFRLCFGTLEMVLAEHKTEVKGFAEETLAGWIPFFLAILNTPLPPAPSDLDPHPADPAAESHRGFVALKLQVVKTLMRIRSVFPGVLSPHSPALFSAIWDELFTLQALYHQMYVENDIQGRMEDADGLPYTLDFLVLEELDFMQACLRAPPVRQALEKQLEASSTSPPNWVIEIMTIAAAYAQITTEEEGLWEVDVNVFLSEEANVTANYTPRTASGDLVIKLGEWLNAATVEGLLNHTRTLYSHNASWKAKEASFYLLDTLIGDFQDRHKEIGAELADGYVEFIKSAMQDEAIFLRARGYLVAGSLMRTSGDALGHVSASFMQASLQAINQDDSEIVKVSSIRALQYYLSALPASVTLQYQADIVASLSNFLNTQDLSNLDDSDDLLTTIVETLRDAMLLDTRTCLENGGIDLLFTMASRGASNFQIAMLVTETFEEVAESISKAGPAQYAALSAKVLPSLMGAFDAATLTEENALANLAADLLSVLAETSPSPMPTGFVATVMPRLSRILLGSTDEELLKAATTSVKHMLRGDADQVFHYCDPTGKGGLETVLIIVDRLLNHAVTDNGAAEVGGLAAELVEKAGAERLGPFLQQLLRAVAVRLATAEQAQFIQSLILVFARLSLVSAQEVVAFLTDVQVGPEDTGLDVVMSKWLENSITFVGYDDIRQKYAAPPPIDLHPPSLCARR